MINVKLPEFPHPIGPVRTMDTSLRVLLGVRFRSLKLFFFLVILTVWLLMMLLLLLLAIFFSEYCNYSYLRYID